MTPARVTAPWRCSRRTAPSGAGHPRKAATIVSIASSVRVARKVDHEVLALIAAMSRRTPL
ncbi:MAG: hypothetical protein Q8Q85_04020 [Gemmatimonadales bacterium]|nr:hypothetical protein [Gemmatimonadales bacterium]